MPTETGISSVSSVQALREVFKQHEDNLVIEFGTDRIVTWLGVYFIFILGAILKIEELFGNWFIYLFKNFANFKYLLSKRATCNLCL